MPVPSLDCTALPLGFSSHAAASCILLLSASSLLHASLVESFSFIPRHIMAYKPSAATMPASLPTIYSYEPGATFTKPPLFEFYAAITCALCYHMPCLSSLFLLLPAILSSSFRRHLSYIRGCFLLLSSFCTTRLSSLLTICLSPPVCAWFNAHYKRHVPLDAVVARERVAYAAGQHARRVWLSWRCLYASWTALHQRAASRIPAATVRLVTRTGKHLAHFNCIHGDSTSRGKISSRMGQRTYRW